MSGKLCVIIVHLLPKNCRMFKIADKKRTKLISEFLSMHVTFKSDLPPHSTAGGILERTE